MQILGTVVFLELAHYYAFMHYYYFSRNQFVPRPLGNILGSPSEISLDLSWKLIKTFGVDAGVIFPKCVACNHGVLTWD